MKKKKQQKENSERWLLTYSDLITLLMALFIVMFAISNVDSQKYAELSQSLNGAMGNGQKSDSIFDGTGQILDIGVTAEGTSSIVNNGTTTGQTSGAATGQTAGTSTDQTTGQTTTTTTSGGTLTEQAQLQKLESDIKSILDQTDISSNVTYTLQGRGLVISFSDDVLFSSGNADILESMKQYVNDIAIMLNQCDNNICIEGYTDNIPIHNALFASNWQLSSMRASNVVEYLADYCSVEPSRLSAVGYGEFQPITANDTDTGRAKNRRVDIVILYDSVSK